MAASARMGGAAAEGGRSEPRGCARRGPQFQYKQGARLVVRDISPRPARFCSPAFGSVCGRAASSREGEDWGPSAGRCSLARPFFWEDGAGPREAGWAALRSSRRPGSRAPSQPALTLRPELPGAPWVLRKPGASELSPAQSAPPKPRTGESLGPAAEDARGCPGSGPSANRCGAQPPGPRAGRGLGFALLLSP